MKGISNFLKIISWKLKATPIAGIMIILLARQQIRPAISVVLTMQNHNLCLIGRKSLFSLLLDSSFINSRHLPFSRNWYAKDIHFELLGSKVLTTQQ